MSSKLGYDAKMILMFIDRIALAKQGDNALDSICPSVCPDGSAVRAQTDNKWKDGHFQVHYLSALRSIIIYPRIVFFFTGLWL